MLTYFPLTALTLLGDAPGVASVSAGATFDLSALPPWVGYLLPALGLFLFSLLVGALNAVIRQRDADGVTVSPRLRLVAAILNAAAANLDKSKQQAALANGTTAPRPSDPTAGAPEQKP
jgi:hypothetical protein